MTNPGLDRGEGGGKSGGRRGGRRGGRGVPVMRRGLVIRTGRRGQMGA